MGNREPSIDPASIATTLLRAPVQDALTIIEAHFAGKATLAEVNRDLKALQTKATLVLEQYLLPEFNRREAIARKPGFAERWND